MMGRHVKYLQLVWDKLLVVSRTDDSSLMDSELKIVCVYNKYVYVYVYNYMNHRCVEAYIHRYTHTFFLF